LPQAEGDLAPSARIEANIGDGLPSGGSLNLQDGVDGEWRDVPQFSLVSFGQRGTEMANLIVNVSQILHSVRDFIAQEPPVTLPQIVQLFFYHGLCDT
jgi:hypothetical protein